MAHESIRLKTLAIEEARDVNSPGDRFDDAVLEAVLKFKTAIRLPGVCYELTPEGSAQGRFSLDEVIYEQVSERKAEIPASKAWVVSGKLDEIKHSAGRFQLVLNQGARLFGKLSSSELDTEALRSLWGSQATVEGMVHIQGQWPATFNQSTPDEQVRRV